MKCFITSFLIIHSVIFAASQPSAGSSKDWSDYEVSSYTYANDGDSLGFNSRLNLVQDQQLQYGPSFKQLEVLVQPQTADRLYVRIIPVGQQRWMVPESIVQRPRTSQGLSWGDLLYEVQQQPLTAAQQPFALTVTRKATGQPVLDTRGHSFLFKDQFIELTTAVPEDCDLYGLGETTLSGGLLLPRDGKVVTMWVRDLASAYSGINTYGAHPFYLQLNQDGTAQGVLMLNSNGMDILLNKTSVNFRSIGGIVELYLFLGPDPEAVIRQYHEVIGTPMMPPYWALGAQQGKWGYADLSELEAVVANYSKAGLPLEAIWADIEAMNNRFQVFTFDKDRYPPAKMRAFADKLHAAGQHWSAIFNPGIGVQRGYRAYEEGTAQELWIKDVNGNPYKGQVWPGEVVYPSYLGDKAAGWLKSQMQAMYDTVPFDGMWLDMSEAANFCSGMVCELPQGNKTAMWALEFPTPPDFDASYITTYRCRCQMSCQMAHPSNKLANPPYAIHNFAWKDGAPTQDSVRDTRLHGNFTAHLDDKVISVTATHPDGTSEYNAHNLYGTAMARHFHNAYKEVARKRVFLLTRSTFPGAGRYTGHWTGDNKVTWTSFREQTASILSANMWGLAMTGADICGYGIEGKTGMSDKDMQELCVRWTSAGAFYPFSRNHMNYFAEPHEPFRWASTTAAAKKAYGLRYQLLSYLYSSLYLAHSKGGTLARPVFFNNPSDLKARNATWQWMLGEALLVSPVMTNETDVIEPYFTAGAWYSAWDYTRLDSTGNTVRMRVPLGDIAVHLRGGAVVPMQRYAPVTRDVRWSPVKLVVAVPAANSPAVMLPYALEEQCTAARRSLPSKLVSCGLLYADNDAPEVTDADSIQAWFIAAINKEGDSGTITSTVLAAAPQLKDKLRITQIDVIGLPSKIVESPGIISPTSFVNLQDTRAAGQASFEGARGVLSITGLDLLASVPFSITWHLA